MIAATADKLGTAGPYKVIDIQAVTDLVFDADLAGDHVAPLKGLVARLHRTDKDIAP